MKTSAIREQIAKLEASELREDVMFRYWLTRAAWEIALQLAWTNEQREQ